MKSAGLIDAALAQAKTADAAAAVSQTNSMTSSATHGGSRSGSISSKTYWPVANWTDKPPVPPMCKPDPLDETGERQILLHLKQRANSLNLRAAALDRQKQELDAAKAALNKQIAALKPLAAHLEAINSVHQSDNARKWASLVSTYETMEPRSAARIFDGLDPAIVFNVLKRMNDRKAALILANMTPEKAQIATEKLAGVEGSAVRAKPVASLLPDGAP